MFIERSIELVHKYGLVGMITMQSWMFLSSYEKLRNILLRQITILSMAHLGSRGFDSIGGEVVQTTAFVLKREHISNFMGSYLRLVDGCNEAEKQQDFKNNSYSGRLLYEAMAENFFKIPGSPIAYWANNSIVNAF